MERCGPQGREASLRRGDGLHRLGSRRRRASLRTRIAGLAAFGVAALTAALPAQASLGHASASVEVDRAHLAARAATTQAATHTVQTLSLPNGGTVREFMSPDGTVFAVSWRGPGRPDLRQLLGEHFDTMQSQTVVRAGRRLSEPLAVNRSDFVVHTGGHPGAFWGMAYLPQQVPAGVTAKDLQAQ